MNIKKRLSQFANDREMLGKGGLCVALVVTRIAKTEGLPLRPESLKTAEQGQVRGLGRSAVQAILKDHGITTVLAEEGGRTSRGNMGRMEAYVKLLNELRAAKTFDLGQIEDWWVERVRDFIRAKPFVLRYDPAKSLTHIIRDLLTQAEKLQRRAAGTTHVGTVLHHLVGAKLELVYGKKLDTRSVSSADASSKVPADFVVGDVAVHVTTSAGAPLMDKCRRNLDSSLRPLIVTTGRRVALAVAQTEDAGIGDRVDVFDAEQFIAGNLYELGGFVADGRSASTGELVKRYNEIVKRTESDPALQVKVGD
jgi:hypothetical protein